MDYLAIEKISQIFALIFFLSLFVAVCIYTFWPGNKERFEKAAELPLNDDTEPKVRD